MTGSKIQIRWVTIPRWHEANLMGFPRVRGLFRARLGGEAKFIGFAAETDLGARLGAYRAPNGTWQKHKAGHLIYKHRAEIDMQIAELDLPAAEIRYIADRMIAEKRPPWNVIDVYRRR